MTLVYLLVSFLYRNAEKIINKVIKQHFDGFIFIILVSILNRSGIISAE
jgi:hypothetical protein